MKIPRAWAFMTFLKQHESAHYRSTGREGGAGAVDREVSEVGRVWGISSGMSQFTIEVSLTPSFRKGLGNAPTGFTNFLRNPDH